MWAIGQQVLTNRLIGPPPQHNVRPPAERQLKSAGGGQDAAGARSGSNGAARARARVPDTDAGRDGRAARDRHRGFAGQRPGRAVRRGWRSAAAAPRRGARRAPAHRQHRLPARARRRPLVRRRLPRLPQGQGCRAEADGALQHGESQDVRSAAGDRTAQSLCPPPRAHHRRRGSAAVVGEHRRRVSEDGHHFVA